MFKVFKNVLFCLFITLLLTSCVYAKDFKFVQVTDSHFCSNGVDTDGRNIAESVGILKAAVKNINSLKNIDFVIFTGDNIDKANKDDLIKFLKIANGLNVPYYIAIGNHDVFKTQDLTSKDYMAVVSKYSKNCREKKPNYVFKRDGIVFIVLDGAKEVIPGPNGYYKKDTLKWFDKELTKYQKQEVIVFQHFPIVAPFQYNSHTTYDIEDYKAVLKKHNNIIAIFSGHYHANGEQMVNGIYHVSSPALIVPPHYYKLVEIETGKRPQIYTQLRHAE